MEDIKHRDDAPVQDGPVQEAPAEDKADEKLAQAIVALCEGHPIRVVSVALQLAQMRVNAVVGNQNFVDIKQP